jgi:hypothetical protein
MSTSSSLSFALRELSRSIENLLSFVIHPITGGLSEGWAPAMRQEIAPRAMTATALAGSLERDRANAEGRVQTVESPLEADIDRARRRALDLISLLDRHPDLASVRFDRWPEEVYRRKVNELAALNARIQTESRELLANPAESEHAQATSIMDATRPATAPVGVMTANATMTAAQIASELGITKDAAEGRLKRARKANMNCFMEVKNRRPIDPKYLYFRAIVWPMIDKE